MATTKTSAVVADAGPLIHLDELEALDVLSDYSEIRVPAAVWQEVICHRPSALANRKIQFIQCPSPPGSSRINALSALYTLHSGEQEALNLCLQHSIGVLLCDDAAARLAANSLDIVTHGTLGLLIRAVRRGLRSPDEVIALLRSIPQHSTLHVRSDLLTTVIKQVQHEWQQNKPL